MELFSIITAKANYWAYIILMMVGLYALIVKNNLVKKIVGMTIFQTAVILFYISIGYKKGATIPILRHGHGEEVLSHGAAAVQEAVVHGTAALQEAAAHGAGVAQEAAVHGTAAVQEAAVHGVAAVQEAAVHGVAAVQEAAAHGADVVQAVDYINPLPHVLMLTAIVVGVATLGVALALVIKVYKEYGTVEEDEINQQLRNG